MGASVNSRHSRSILGISTFLQSGPKILGMWVSNQRTQRKQGLLRADRVTRLDEINFVWDAIDTMWNRMFAALQNYKVEHGNCEVPQGWQQNLKLGTWVSRQRSLRKIGKL